MLGRSLIVVVLLAGLVAVALAAASRERHEPPLVGLGDAAAGRVQLVRPATPSFSSFITDSTPAQRAWMRSAYWRMRGFPPFFDQALKWAPPSHFYKDLYALYRDEPADRDLLDAHPDWVLRDTEGDPLYIPFECSGDSCPAYAADPGNAEWRAHWIETARGELEKGYAGVFIDNVNMLMRVGNGAGTEVAPIDPRTGEPMTLDDWRLYVTEFVEEIRVALPEAEIVHNVVWFADREDGLVERQTLAADLIELERGFSDPGLDNTASNGYEAFLEHVDWIHATGRPVLLETYGADDATRELELASYLLTSTGLDAIASGYETDPDNYWPGWDVELGAALGTRREWNGVLRRDFENGFALVNPPGREPTTLDLGSEYRDLDGVVADSVTLNARDGAVFIAPGP